VQKILVNDTNILIDLMAIGLLESFLSCNFEFHTNDLIMNEITNEAQKQQVLKLANEGKLFIAETKAQDYTDIFNLKVKNLSFEDCSIWHYTTKIQGTLLTGDGNLRKEVEKTTTDVKGILYVFDVLIENEKLSNANAIEKIKQLYVLNNRLPKKEIEKRIKKWS